MEGGKEGFGGGQEEGVREERAERGNRERARRGNEGGWEVTIDEGRRKFEKG